MINFGVRTDNKISVDHLGESNLFKTANYKGIAATNTELNFESLLKTSDAVLFLGDTAPQPAEIVSAIKLSRHIFLENLPLLHSDELKRLYKLSEEAGILIYVKNHLINKYKNLKKPGISNELPKHISIERNITKANYRHSGLMKYLFLDIQFLISASRSYINKHHLNNIMNSINEHSFIHLSFELENACTATIDYDWISGNSTHRAFLYNSHERKAIDFIQDQARTNETELAIKHFFKVLAGETIPYAGFEASLMAYSLSEEIIEHLGHKEKLTV